MPTGLDIQYFLNYGTWPDQPLLDALQSAKTPFINIGDGIQKICQPRIRAIYLIIAMHILAKLVMP